jgi:hypothetical protein
MKSTLEYIKTHRWRTLILCALLAGLGMTSMSVAAAKKRVKAAHGLVSVQFSADCASATVESSRPIGSMVAVFNDDRWEEMDGMTDVRTYVIRVGKNASQSGLAIVSIYVDSHARMQKDPLGIVPHNVGVGFECGANA